jgi:hypothetical protein
MTIFVLFFSVKKIIFIFFISLKNLKETKEVFKKLKKKKKMSRRPSHTLEDDKDDSPVYSSDYFGSWGPMDEIGNWDLRWDYPSRHRSSDPLIESTNNISEFIKKFEGVNHDHIVIPDILPKGYRGRSPSFTTTIILLQNCAPKYYVSVNGKTMKVIESTSEIIESLITRLRDIPYPTDLADLLQNHWKYFLEEITDDSEQMEVDFLGQRLQQLNISGVSPKTE